MFFAKGANVLNFDQLGKWFGDKTFDEHGEVRDTNLARFLASIFLYLLVLYILLETLTDQIFYWAKSLMTRRVIVPIYAVGLSVFLAFDFRQEFLSLVYWNTETLTRSFTILNLSLFGIIVFIFGSSGLFWVLLSSDKKIKNLR